MPERPSRRTRKTTTRREAPKGPSSQRTSGTGRSSRKSEKGEGKERETRTSRKKRSTREESGSGRRSERTTRDNAKSASRSTRTERTSGRRTSSDTPSESGSRRSTSARKSARTSTRKSGREETRSDRSQSQRRSSTRSSTRGSTRERTATSGRRSRRGDEPVEKKSHTKLIVAAVALVVVGLGGYMAYGMYVKSKLFTDLRSTDSSVRASALTSLVAYGTSMRDDFWDVVDNKNAEKDWPDASRADAARGLVRFGNKRCDKEVLERLKELAKKPDSPVAGWLLRGLALEEAGSRASVEEVLPYAESTVPATRLYAATLLGAHKSSQASAALAKCLSDTDPAVVKAAGESIFKTVTTTDTALLIGLLEHEKEEVRSIASDALGMVVSEESAPAIREAFDGGSEEVQMLLLKAAQEHAQKPAIQQVIGMASSSSRPAVQKEALVMIGKAKIRSQFGALETASSHANPDVRIAVMEGVKYCGDRKLANKLLPMVKDSDPSVRIAALQAMRAQASYTKEFKHMFVERFDDEDEAVAGEALKQIRLALPKHAKLYGGSLSAWRKWWALYTEQHDAVESLKVKEEEISELLGRQENEAYKKAKIIIDQQMAKIKTLLRRRDLVPELGRGTSMRRSLEDIQNKLPKQRYTAMKHQSM